jgi:hypothetical protein
MSAALPLWMLVHMTVGGDGLHGRAIEGWSLIFNVVFRPTLHQNEELIFRSETLPLNARFYDLPPARMFEEMY